MAAASLTPVEDGMRAQQEATPLPTDPFNASVLRVVRAANIEMARILDRGGDWNRAISLSSYASASIIDSIIKTACSTMGIPEAEASLKRAVLQEITTMLAREPHHHVTTTIDRGDKPGRA